MHRLKDIVAALLWLWASCSPLVGQTSDAAAPGSEIGLTVRMTRPGKGVPAGVRNDAGSAGSVVVWLRPVRAVAQTSSRPAGSFTLTQKDRQFRPRLLVVPTGSTVDFPNLDPFFHNVFSLFSGKRFDLGLYEAGSRHTVHFDREGISYIFCNIHPEMAAVVIALSTPYYAVTGANGSVVFHSVPPGTYRLEVWAENVSRQRLDEAARVVEVSAGHHELAPLELELTAGVPAPHLNKFGEPYAPTEKAPY